MKQESIMFEGIVHDVELINDKDEMKNAFTFEVIGHYSESKDQKLFIQKGWFFYETAEVAEFNMHEFVKLYAEQVKNTFKVLEITARIESSGFGLQ